MLPPVVCFTCGMPIGDVAPLYAALKSSLMAEKAKELDLPVTQITLSADIQINMRDILEKTLKIRLECCRKTLTANAEFLAYY